MDSESSFTTEEQVMKNYIVSTIQYNALVNKNLLTNMLHFADNQHVSKIYMFVMQGAFKDEDILPTFDDPRIELITKNGKLNNNIKLHDTGILASQINPLTGFNMKLHRDFSYLLPSPKIRYLSIPNTSENPRFLATTGALTHGNYRDNAQGRKAKLEHQYGFAYVEVKNGRRFDYHPVEAMKNGNFHYNREYYKNGKVIDESPEALVLGDWHTGDTCPKTRLKTIKMIDTLKPKRVFFHDLFNGHSINHHERENHLSAAKSWANKMNVLEKEVSIVLKEIEFFAKKFPDVEFFVVESNHDLFLAQYIGLENFLKDGCNSVFACKLFVAVMEGETQPILKTALEIVGNVPKNFRFLNEDEELRVHGIGLDYHGHRGVNGSRGSSASFNRFNLKLITGHEHTPKLHANGMVVGTSTHLKLGYTKGAGSWLNAHAILYSTGKYSLITIIH